VNKLELIKKLTEECEISKKEAAAVVDMFLIKSRRRLQRVSGLRSVGCALFLSKNMMLFRGAIRQQVSQFEWLPRNYRFLRSEKN
jgi:hypothetical protein